jgi:glycosyltransferase involved in cell wall biosynthesis
MKVSFVLPGFGRSGGSKVTVVVANGLISRGHHVRLFVHKPNTFSRSRLRNEWLKIRYLRTNDWQQLFIGCVEPFKDLTKCRFENNEIVVAVGLWSCRELSRQNNSNIKKVHYIHGAPPGDVNLMKEAWCENVPKIAVASFLKQKVKDICGQDVIAVIPNGIDTNEYYPSVPESERDGIGTMFSFPTYYKDPDPQTILSVLRRLGKSRPQVPQRIFGACRRPKEVPRVVYTRLPSIEKAREIYSRSLVWVLASRTEGFGLPVLEAMACGCAVVATDSGGPRDMIVDGKNGFLVGVGDVDSIVEKVELLLNDDALRCHVVEESRKIVKKFNWEASITKLEQALQKIDVSDL